MVLSAMSQNSPDIERGRMRPNNSRVRFNMGNEEPMQALQTVGTLSNKSSNRNSYASDIERASSRKASFFIGDDKENVPLKIVGPDDEEIHPDEIIVAPDGGWGWMVAFASFISNIVVDGIILSFGLMAEPIKNSFEEAGMTYVTTSNIAWISSILNGFYLLGGPFVAALANKFGFRVVAVLGAIIGCLGFVISYLLCRDVPSLYSLYIFYGVVGGIGFNCLYVPSVIAVGFYFVKKRALATGIAICGSGVGTFIFAPLTYYLVNNFGWRNALLVHAALVLCCVVCGAMYRPVKPQKTSEPNRAEGEKKQITPFESPMGTPLLMRIKRAREQQMWDSTTSVENFTQQNELDTNLSQSNRKASTQSLNNPGPMQKQVKRMSVPSMGMVGDVPLVRSNTASSVKGKVKGDLTEIQEEENEHNEDDPLSSNNIKKENTVEEMSKSVVSQTKIGNSTYTVDEMTRSRILRVSSKNIINKALYRDDIFYTGSMKRIPEYAETVDKGRFSSYEWSAIVASKPNVNSTEPLKPYSQDSGSKVGKKASIWRKLSVVQKMLDFSLLASPTFVLLAVAGAFTMSGFFVPFIFLKGVSMQNGVAESDAPMLISVIGIANTIGRVMCGWLADRPEIKAVVMNNVALTIGGISTMVVPFLNNYWLFVTYSVVFGLAMACYVSLRSILLVDLLGLNRLTNAFGLLCLFQGVAAMCGAPLAGFLYDSTGNYDMTFYVAGGLILLSGVMVYPIECVNRRESRKE